MDYVGVCTRCGGVVAWIASEMPKQDQKRFALDIVGDDRLRLTTMETDDARKANWCMAGKKCDGTGKDPARAQLSLEVTA